jgi:hypothetical protein
MGSRRTATCTSPGRTGVARASSSTATSCSSAGRLTAPRSPTRTPDPAALFVLDVATGETRRILDHDEWPEWVDEDTMIVDLSD